MTGVGSLFNLHVTDDQVADAASAGTSLDGEDGEEFNYEFYLAVRREEIFVAPRGTSNVSTPMTTAEVDAFADAFTSALDSVTG